MEASTPLALPLRGEKFGFDRIDLVDMAGEHQVEAEAFRLIRMKAVDGGDDDLQLAGQVRQAVADVVDVHFKRRFL